jgi:hypothetical protein
MLPVRALALAAASEHTPSPKNGGTGNPGFPVGRKRETRNPCFPHSATNGIGVLSERGRGDFKFVVWSRWQPSFLRHCQVPLDLSVSVRAQCPP